MMTSGPRVLKLPAIGPVPFCGALLADMGADVVRIDRATAAHGTAMPVVDHDINYLALSGALHCIAEKGRPPAPPLNLVADLGGGAMYLAAGVLAGRTEARRSGRGQVVETAMVDGVANLMSAFFAFRQMGESTSERAENIVDGGAPFYGIYETRDGKYVAVGAIEVLAEWGVGASAIEALARSGAMLQVGPGAG